MSNVFGSAVAGLCAWTGVNAVTPALAQTSQDSKPFIEKQLSSNVNSVGVFSLGRGISLHVTSYNDPNACYVFLDNNPYAHGACVDNFGGTLTSAQYAKDKLHGVSKNPNPISESALPDGANAVGLFSKLLKPGLSMKYYASAQECLTAMARNVRINGACIDNEGKTISSIDLYALSENDNRLVHLFDTDQTIIRFYPTLDACLTAGQNADPKIPGALCMEPGARSDLYISGYGPGRITPVSRQPH